MTDEIKNHWRVHELPEGRPISLRALKPSGSQLAIFPQNRTFHPSEFSCPEALKLAFENDALSLNKAGYNGYTVMNLIRPDIQGNVAVRDTDITHRTTILVDIDRVGDTSRPASDAEVDAAFDLSVRIGSHLAEQGFPDPWRVHSGNGCHLYYRMAATFESQSSSQAVERLLSELSMRFNNGIVGIDTVVFNASRITKVIGTVARKGNESEGRPYRIARLV